MLTNLDLLVIVFMGLAAATFLSVGLMFLIKNETIRKICFYIATALGLYVANVGIYIGFTGLFFGQLAVGIVTLLALMGAIVLERTSKNNEKKFQIARIISAAALIVGLINAIL